MFRVRDEWRKAAARGAVHALEDRAVLRAGAAALEVLHHRAIGRLNAFLRSRVDRIQSMLTRRDARIDARHEGAPIRSAARIGSGPTLARADARVNGVAVAVDQKLASFTAELHRRLASVTGRFGKARGAIRPANPYVTPNFQNALAADDAGLPDEPQAGQGILPAASGPAEASVAQAGTSGAPAQAPTEAAAGQPADAGESQPASERSAVAEFWDRYYGSFKPTRAEMAAIASAQLLTARQ